LPKPRFSSQQIFDLMLLCWKAHPEHRPKFKLLWGFIKVTYCSYINSNTTLSCFGLFTVMLIVQECTISVVDVRESHSAADQGQLDLLVGDKVLVIDNV